MSKQLFVSGLGNRIYYTDAVPMNEHGQYRTTGEKVDLTDNAIRSVAEHMKNLADDSKSRGFEFTWKGFGTLSFMKVVKDIEPGAAEDGIVERLEDQMRDTGEDDKGPDSGE